MTKAAVELDESLVDIHPHANAFRVSLAGTGPDCLLDFLFWVPEENRASLVSRIRVQSGFLPAIRQRLNLALKELGESVSVG